MFSYCRNNPVTQQDTSGTDDVCAVDFNQNNNPLDDLGNPSGGSSGGGGIIVVSPDLFAPPPEPQKTLKQEVYKYSLLSKIQLDYDTKRSPHVHHIVPVGAFNRRSPTIRRYITEMHEILADAGINRWIDPNNLMLVSAGTHAALHTDGYIAHVYSYISAARGSREGIYLALFYLRLEIAAEDHYALGY